LFESLLTFNFITFLGTFLGPIYVF